MRFAEILETGAAIITGVGGGGAVVFGLSNYLGKRWADRAIERLRQEGARDLQQQRHEMDLLTERAKNALHMSAEEHRVRFSWLYEKRARVIAALDKKLCDLEARGMSFLSDFMRAGDRAYSAWTEEYFACRALLESRKIYLPEELYCLVYEYLAEAKTSVIDVWVTAAGADSTEARRTELHRDRERVLRAVEALNGRIPAMRSKLQGEFRRILAGA